MSPRSPFGQVVAAAFDRAMSPAEWLLFTGPDAHPQLRVACLMAWHGDVLPKMALAHGVTIAGLPGP